MEDCSRADRLDGVDFNVEVSGLSDTKRHGKDYPTDFETQRPSLASDAGVCPLRASPVRMSGCDRHSYARAVGVYPDCNIEVLRANRVGVG
jgi:hypothetical protein